MQDTDFDLDRLPSRRRSGLLIGTAASVVVAIVALTALTARVDAQDPKPTAKKSKSAPQPAAAEAASAQAAAPAPQIQTTTYDQWTVVCQEKADATPRKACSAVLKVVDPNRKQVVFAWVLARTPEGRIATVMQSPTGVQVQRGITLKLGDAGQPHVMPYASCEPQNCEVSQVLDDSAVHELETAPQAVATIYAKDGRGIQFTMPLKGIDKALAAVRS